MSDNQPIFSITTHDIECIILEYVYEYKPESNDTITTDFVKGLAGFLHQRIEKSLNLPFNGISPAEAERLALLIEEMGEAQQAVGKILRHGYESRHPDGGPTNRGTLERELGDVEFAGGMLKNNQDLSAKAVESFKRQKSYRVYQYLHHHEEFVEIT